MKEVLEIILFWLPFFAFAIGAAIGLTKYVINRKLIKFPTLDFSLIVFLLRWYLAYYMIDYGFSKLLGGQFGGINNEILHKPLKDIDRFYLTWHLFSSFPLFNIIIGTFQVLGGVFLLMNRTVLLGLLIIIPLLIGILFVDIFSTFNLFGFSLILRVLFMLLSSFIVLMSYKAKIIAAINSIKMQSPNNEPRFNWYFYLMMPLIGLLVDFVIMTFLLPFRYLLEYLIK